MRHAVYCATRNLYDVMELAAKSLVANSHVDKVHFLIEDPEFPRELPGFVECHDVSGQEWIDRNGPNAKSRWTWMVLVRAALCHILPDVDRVLSLDCDTIVHADATPIWSLPVDDCYYAAVTERHKSTDGLQYGNFGVVLFNLEKLRDGKADECIDVINRCRYSWPEQDVFNYLCQGRILEMPRKYNDMGFNGVTENPAITHYAGQPNDSWTSLREPSMYREMSWDEVLDMRDTMGYRDKLVMFTSDHSLERAENLRAVYEAYKLPKRFVQGTAHMEHAAWDGYAAVVCDTLPRYMPDKGGCKSIVIGHGITGDKKYALDEKRRGIDARAFQQIDASVNASTKTVDIMASQFGIPAERVYPLGMPRTDAYVGKRKGDGGTYMAKYRRAYLYAPTYRGRNDGRSLPRIDWEKLDGLLDDDEIVVVKRHYFQRNPIVMGEVDHIMEEPPSVASAPYLIDCDVLLTDYSSILFDGYVLGKPSVLTVDDMDAYMETRGMYLDYPGQYSSRHLCAEGHEEELLAMLREAAENGFNETERECLDLVADMCDGNSAKRVCRLILGLMAPDK